MLFVSELFLKRDRKRLLRTYLLKALIIGGFVRLCRCATSSSV